MGSVGSTAFAGAMSSILVADRYGPEPRATLAGAEVIPFAGGLPAIGAGLPPDPLVPTIFHEPWWLDIVTQREWEKVESIHDGRVVGRMVFLRKPRLWIETSRMPMLTHFLGPGVDEGEGQPNTRALRRHAITRDMIGKLPRMAAFSQKMHRDVPEVIPFQMEGFGSSVQFTYELAPAPAPELWGRMRDKTRNAARKAAKSGVVCEDMQADEFTELYLSNLAASGREAFLDMTIMARLIEEGAARKCGRIWALRDAAGVAKAAIFCVWDQRVCYYLLSTRHPDSNSGAVTLLLWSAIQAAAAGGLVFDFDGLGYAGAVLFYTGFGARVRPRFIVSKTNLTFRLLREGRRLLGNPDNAFT